MPEGDWSDMSVATWSAVIGTIAACCSTLAFLPQLVKVRRQGGEDVSSAMLAMYLAGLGLWLVYGVVNGAGSIRTPASNSSRARSI